MEEFVAYIIKNLVSYPDAVEIRSQVDNDNIKLEIHVSVEDIGKVIGRRGNTIHALRTIVRRISSRVKKKVQIDLIQPEGSREVNNTDAIEDIIDDEVIQACCALSCGSDESE